jgi:hypothetical protein
MSRKDRVLKICKKDRRWLYDSQIHYSAGLSGKVDTTRHACDELCTQGRLEKRHKSRANGCDLTQYRGMK